MPVASGGGLARTRTEDSRDTPKQSRRGYRRSTRRGHECPARSVSPYCPHSALHQPVPLRSGYLLPRGNRKLAATRRKRPLHRITPTPTNRTAPQPYSAEIRHIPSGASPSASETIDCLQPIVRRSDRHDGRRLSIHQASASARLLARVAWPPHGEVEEPPYMRQAIGKHLNELEHAHATPAHVEDIVLGRVRTWSLVKVEKPLDPEEGAAHGAAADPNAKALLDAIAACRPWRGGRSGNSPPRLTRGEAHAHRVTPDVLEALDR